MKKIIVFLVLVFVLLFPVVNINAQELPNSTIIKYNYYPSFSANKELTFQWTSNEEMEDLSIKIYVPTEDKYVELYNSNWDLDKEQDSDDKNNNLGDQIVDGENQESSEPNEIDEILAVLDKYNVDFKILVSHEDDLDTPNIDESENKNWEYRLKFTYNDTSLAVMEIVLDYKANDRNYTNSFILQNIVTPQIRPSNPDVKEEDNFEENNALFAAIFAAVCSVIGTVLIISSTSNRILDDEREPIE